MILDDELHYKIVTLLEEDPNISQRELSRRLEISLGKVNFCLKALIEKGWIKMENFRKSDNKKAYSYLLTSGGIKQKAKVTASFLQRKITEYESLKEEIEQLRSEVNQMEEGN